MYLIAGATGALGSAIARQLAGNGTPFRALVRPQADAEKMGDLEALGAELAEGDLKDRESLDRACRGVSAVFSTVTSVLSQEPGDSIATVDRDGQINLVGAAEDAGADRFVYVSFSRHIDSDAPLTNAKREVEKRLEQGPLRYTILRPSFFMERAFHPMLGFDLGDGKVVVYGSGETPISFVSIEDVARFGIAAVQTDAASRQTFEVGGPEALTQLEAIEVFEELSGRTLERSFVPEEALRAQLATATDPKMQSFAGLSLDFATGVPVDMTDALAKVPVPLTSLRDFATALLQRQEPATVSGNAGHHG
jgi:uncharacterized protein YbjT (DUF2867 family)